MNEPRDDAAVPPTQAISDPATDERSATAEETVASRDTDDGDAMEQARVRAAELNTYRRWLLGVDHDTSVTFDKVLVTLSAGALVIAVNLGREAGVWLWSLKLSWALFTVSLLAMLLSYRACRREAAMSIKDIDWKLRHGDDEPRPSENRSWHEVTTSMLNEVALSSLIFGICFLIAFATMNL